MGIAVQMRLKGDARFGDLAQAGEAEDLESAGIRQDGARPRHEAVQAAKLADGSMAGRK